MRRVLVTGAGGFLAAHLIPALQAAGYQVAGIDRHAPAFGPSPADRYTIADLTDWSAAACLVPGYDAVVDLAAAIGGVGYLTVRESTPMTANTRLNLNVLEAAARDAARRSRSVRYLFLSSAMAYPAARQCHTAAAPLREEEAWQGRPGLMYGTQKLYHEQLVAAYAADYPLEPRIARLDNTYGPLGAWTGGREKVPAALCRKVAEAKRDRRASIPVWGDGQQQRAFLYVADAVAGLVALLQSAETAPVNLGGAPLVTVDALAQHVQAAAGVTVRLDHVPGPESARARHLDCRRAQAVLGWQPRVSLADGIARTYAWVEQQVLAREAVYA